VLALGAALSTSEPQDSWLQRIFSNIELKRSEAAANPEQEFWGVRGKRGESDAETELQHLEDKRGTALKPNSLFGSLGKKALKPNSLFGTYGKRALKPNSLFGTYGKRGLKPNSLFGTYGKRYNILNSKWGKRSLKPNSLFTTLGKRNLKPNSLFGTVGKRVLKPNSLFSAYKRYPSIKPNGLFSVGKRALLKPNGLFSMSKRAILEALPWLYDSDDNDELVVDNMELEDDESESEPESLKRSVDPSFWAARGKKDGMDDFFAARGRRSEVVLPTDFDFFAARGKKADEEVDVEVEE